MHWLLWVLIFFIVILVAFRIALVEYCKTIPNFGTQQPHIIEDDTLGEYHKSAQWTSFKEKCNVISKESKDKELRMYKKNTNTYRTKSISSKNRLNFNVFNNVIGLKITKDESKNNDDNTQDYYWADVEASCTYDTFVHHCLRYGFMPTVMPELKSITVGGAIVGGGIESSSFRYGLVHESMLECDVILSDGSVVTCNSSNEYSDLFHGLPNSLGSFGYLLRVRMRIVKSKKYVLMTNIYCSSHKTLSDTILSECDRAKEGSEYCGDYDFIDGIAYVDGTGRVLTGKLTDNVDSRTGELLSCDDIYHAYVNLHKRESENGIGNVQFYMAIEDYVWRWDSDLFWCIQYIAPLQNKYLRQYLSQYVMRSDSLRHLHKLIFGRDIIVQNPHETEKGNQMFIQDIIIPAENVFQWLQFHHDEILYLNTKSKDPLAVKHPLWLCPTKGNMKDYPLIKVNDETMNINFGFWSTVEWDRKVNLDTYVEQNGIKKMNGMKFVYSTVAYGKEEFYEIYNGKKYFELKGKYDKKGRIRHLYEKCTTN